MPDYPGLGRPLRFDSEEEHPFYPLGIYTNCAGSRSFILPVRELAMLSVMERLTDKENWHKKVFDQDIVAKWRKEALAVPDKEWWHMAIESKEMRYTEEGIAFYRDEWGWDGRWSPVLPLEGIMDDTAFEFCVRELQEKAKYYEETGLIPTLDACASVVKSDTLVSQDLKDSLGRAFDKLKKDQANCPDWHPNTNDKVQDLVHPSMYPLVYGRTPVIKEEVVGVEDAVEKWAGKGEVIPKETEEPPESLLQSVPNRFWSNSYQWLPANIALQEGGSVKFTSYINSLHPNKYPDIYRTIEKLIETALPAWDQCLALYTDYGQAEGAGRMQSRFSRPENPDDGNSENWSPEWKDATKINVEDLDMDEDDWNHYKRMKRDTEIWCEDDITEFKFRKIRKPRQPDPDNEVASYAPEPGKRLFDRFESPGLQVIVKLASIELTPEQPDFPVGGWHVEGQMNEHICATALYYLDSENISESSLAFRMQTDPYLNDDFEDVGQGAHSWMEMVYGTHLGGDGAPSLQNYGRVVTKEGRLLAFPNVFQHRVSPFSLADKTRPGHRRFIALWLVDPTCRVISTANVPPQQQSWWVEAILGSGPAARKEALSKLPAEVLALISDKGLDSEMADARDAKLPPELMEMVRKHFEAEKEALPMSEEEAKEYRLKLMEVRTAHVNETEKSWQTNRYSFCEH